MSLMILKPFTLLFPCLISSLGFPVQSWSDNRYLCLIDDTKEHFNVSPLNTILSVGFLVNSLFSDWRNSIIFLIY